MDTPRSARRKSKICYKEDDSFTEEFNYTPKTNSAAVKSKTRRSILNTTKSSATNDNCLKDVKEVKDTNTTVHKPAKNIETSPTTLLKIKEAKSWNPVVVLSNIYEDTNTSLTPSNTPVRRGTRTRYKTSLAKEAEESCKLFKKLSVTNDNGSDSGGEVDLQAVEKPSALFCDEDVEGKDMFKFKIIHKKESMIKKAMEAVSESPKIKTHYEELLDKGNTTPKTPSMQKNKINTPNTKGRSLVMNGTPKSALNGVEKTPHHVRSKMKKKLQTIALEESDGSDFEDSGSDFQPSEEEENSSINSSKSENNESESSDFEVECEKVTTKSKSDGNVKKCKAYSLRNAKQDKDHQLVMESDNYFSMQSSKKVVTSNHTLERLKTPRLTEDKLQTILNQQKLTTEHRNAIEELVEDHERLFDKWIYTLSEGFSILLHGVGSKYKLIQDFHLQKLNSHPCIVINGFFPSLTIKDILEMIIVDLLELSSVPSNVFEAVRLIEDEMKDLENDHLFLLIHNIDGAMLKNNKTQMVLSCLAKIKNIHLVASVDHINAPLIWDHSIIRNFNFSWWDVTTLLPYTKETSFESSLMVHNSGALALSSLKNVFQSLTTNARGIFMIIVKNQLKNKKTPHYQGISFKDLYWSSREDFLVSSDLALRAQLTEFLDHKLAKAKRTADGVENLIIPIDNSLLQQFLDENDNC